MTFRSFLLITAVICWSFGAGFLLFPDMMSKLYGVPFSPWVAMLDRFFGSALFGLGLFAWALKDVTDTVLIPRLLVAHGAHDAIGFVVAAYTTATHALNVMGWGVVFIYAALAAGCVVLYRHGPAGQLATA